MSNEFGDPPFAQAEQLNPYQAPPVLIPQMDAKKATDQLLLKKFRSQIQALGILWILFGVLCAAVTIAIFFVSDMQLQEPIARIIFAAILGFLTFIWLISGILSCYKIMPGVWIGLAASYLSLAGNVINFNLCGLVIMLVAIIQGHRVISWASKLSAEGIPLNQKPVI